MKARTAAAVREGGSFSPTAIAYVLALFVYTVYAVGYPWFAARVPAMRARDVVVEASTLVFVGAGVALLGIRTVPAGFVSGARERWSHGLPMALQVFCLLGVIALAVRFADPRFDDLEFAGRGLDTLADVGALLAALPFGVAAEELVFRTCQRHLRRALSPSSACVAVSLGFALFHWVPGTPLDRHQIETLLATFAGGLAFAVTYEGSASVSLLIALHLAYDNLAVMQGWLHVRHESTLEAFVFLVWIAGGAMMAWLFRGRSVVRSGWAPAGATGPAAAWVAALGFGGALPLILAWMRLRWGI